MYLRKTTKEIAQILGLEYEGNGDNFIEKVSSIENSDEKSIVFFEGESIPENIKAGCAIVKRETKIYAKIPSLIFSKNPRLSFAKLLEFIEKNLKTYKSEISKKASIGENVSIGRDVYIGDFVKICDNVKIGDGCVIESNCYIGRNTIIGDNCFIYPGVVIRENIIIGKNCIIHSGSVIGSDGFGYVKDGSKHQKIPQVGNVIIGDDVEIGANVCIDRATIDSTVIGNGTKIDNLVHIAHNVKVGSNCLILAGAGIAGSVLIEDNVIIAGQAGIADHLKIGKNSIIMAQSGVIGNIKEGSVVFGSPARDRNEFMRIQAVLSKLPLIYKKVFMEKDEEKNS